MVCRSIYVAVKFNETINVGGGNGIHSKDDAMECLIKIKRSPEMDFANYNALNGNLLDERRSSIEIILHGIDFKMHKIHITYYNSYILATGL